MQSLKIGFEGLHRSGKGTQMSLLKDYLMENLVNTILIRGEYYRKGKGTQEPFDPHSLRWQQNWNNDSLNQEKSDRMNREIKLFFDNYLAKNFPVSGYNDIAVLFDRTIISRHFLDSLENETLSFESVKYVPTKAGGIVKKIIPDIIFAFECDKNVLLERLGCEQLTPDNLAYKQGIIEQYTEKFNYYLKYKLPEEVRSRTITIDATKDPTIIHEEIKEYLYPYLDGRGKQQ